MDVELIRADPAALNEIKSASPETFNLREVAAETTKPLWTREFSKFWVCLMAFWEIYRKCRFQGLAFIESYLIGLKGEGLHYQ